MSTATQYKPEASVLDTPELSAPPQTADKHRATIQGFRYETLVNKTTGNITHVFRVALKSQDRGFDADYTLFLPKMWAENVGIDPTTLPEAEGNKQRTNYSTKIANARGSAELQVLRKIANDQGRSATPAFAEEVLGEGRMLPTNVEEFGALYNALLTGVEVVFYRKPKKSDDPRYDGRLEVKGIAPIDVVTNPNRLKDYKAAWETTEGN